MKELPESVYKISDQQCGLVTRSQLAKLGLTTAAVNRRIADGLLATVTSRVVSVSLEDVSRKQQLVASVLHFPGMALTGVAALELLGLESAQDRRIDLIGRRGGRVPGLPNMVLHTSRRPLSALSDFPMRTTNEYSVAHAIAWASTADQARFYAYWGLQNKVVTLESLSEVVLSNDKSSIMRRAIPRILSLRDQVDTVNEHRFVTLCRKFELPAPTRKPKLQIDDYVLHADFGFRIDGKMLVVEIDGIQHDSPAGLRIDSYRMEAFRNAGSDTFRIKNQDLKERPEEVFRALRFVLERMKK